MFRRALLAPTFTVALFATSLALVLSACSDDSSPGTIADDAAPEAATPGANEATQTGRVISALDEAPLPGATVAIGDRTVTAGEGGAYAIVVPTGTPYTMRVSAEDHFTLREQEWRFDGTSLARGDASLLSRDTANLLAAFLPARDATKGLVVVRVVPLPPCDSEEGATLEIAPKGASSVTYFASGRPNQSATSVTTGERFAAAIANVDPGVPITVTVTSPLCEQLPFPVESDGVTFTGAQQAEAGDVLSFMRVFLGPRKEATDASAD